MDDLYYIGLDIHKKTISYCVKKVDGTVVQQGAIAAERKALPAWMAGLPGPWCGAMEATGLIRDRAPIVFRKIIGALSLIAAA